MANEVSLIALAAWLRREAEQAEASAQAASDEYGVRLTREAAARLAQASSVVKEAADLDRQGRIATSPRPASANQA